MKKSVVMMMMMAAIWTASCSVAETAVDQASLDGVALTETTGIGTETVKMVSAKSLIHYRYGQSQYVRTFNIRVKNIAYNKVVKVRHQKADGSWTDLNASYIGGAGNGYELWQATYSYTGSSMPLGTKFAVFYTVNGQTYWDNNGGSDFNLKQGDGVLLGKNVKVLAQNSFKSGSQIVVNIDLQNVAYNKTVEVWYSTDNWSSSKKVNASYQSYWYEGYANVKSPNQAGVERWMATIPASSAKFYIKYVANGSSYYDNNYGWNYSK